MAVMGVNRCCPATIQDIWIQIHTMLPLENTEDLMIAGVIDPTKVIY